MNFELNVDITPKMFVRHMCEHDIVDFISEVDFEVASVDFTIKLIKQLKESLKSELSQSEIDEL